MYSDEDLQSAVDAGIFSKQAVQQFRKHIATRNNTVAVDEENFRLVSSFNDIYVVIACSLLLVSIGWFGQTMSSLIATSMIAVTSWALAEYFVLKRHMALPAIVLLLSFLAGILSSTIFLLGEVNKASLLLAGVTTAFAAWLHWKRFAVPITVAGGAAALIGCLLAVTTAKVGIDLQNWFVPLLLFSGLSTFCFAMFWDAQDRFRVTRKSDVAFWLHLLSAPLIVHPVFSLLGILDGNTGLIEAITVIALYILMAMLAVAVDRRAVLVSGLAYVLYAISSLLETVGLDTSSTAITGVIIGGALLLLSVYWQTCRKVLFKLIPTSIQSSLPPLRT
jgi:hypothetical protein